MQEATVTAAILAILGFAMLFAVAGMIPLEKRSCHKDCSAESAADCAGCALAPGNGEPLDDRVAAGSRKRR